MKLPKGHDSFDMDGLSKKKAYCINSSEESIQLGRQSFTKLTLMT